MRFAVWSVSKSPHTALRPGEEAERKARSLRTHRVHFFSQLSSPSRLQRACIVSQQQPCFITAQQNDRKPRMAERPRHGTTGANSKSGIVCFIFLLLERTLSFLGNNDTMCMFQTAAALRRGPNLNLDVQRRKDNIFTGKPSPRSFFSLLVSGSHAAPYLIYHNLNQITSGQLAALAM